MNGHHGGKRLSDRTKDRLAVVLTLWTFVGLGACWYYSAAPTANALSPDIRVTVETGWDDCADLTAPDQHDQTQTITALVCDPPGPPVTYMVRPGQMYGAAVFSPGRPVSCRVLIGDREDAFQSAIGAVNCLARY